MLLRKFYLVIAPGLVKLGEHELQEKWPLILGQLKNRSLENSLTQVKWQVFQDGIELYDVPLLIGCYLNLYLKIPTRILLRVKEFRCRDFPKLFKKTCKIDWDEYLVSPNIKCHVAAHKSRLMHHKRLSATLTDGIRKYFSAKQGRDKGFCEDIAADVYLRLNEDNCVISINTSGEALYKRYPDKKVGKAPIRENLAAALLLFMQNHLKDRGLAENLPASLLDPMAGSGTFLLEAKHYWQAHVRKDYTFCSFPAIKKDVGSRIFQDPVMLKAANLFHSYFAYDCEDSVVEIARENLASSHIEITKNDLFKDVPEQIGSGPRLVIVNPPYGVRLKIAQEKQHYFRKIVSRIISTWRPEVIGILLPQQANSYKLAARSDYKMVAKMNCINGGLKMTFFLLGKTSSVYSMPKSKF